MNEKKIYAAYGSNMNLKQMKKRCPNAVAAGIGILPDYRLVFRGFRRGVANIEKADGFSVPIVLWEITDKCEESLDYYEGYPRMYTKADVSVTVGNQEVKAMAYVMTEKYENAYKMPTGDYYNIIAEGYKDHKLDKDTLKGALDEAKRKLAEDQPQADAGRR